MPKRIISGTVVSTKMDKTVVVLVDVPKTHSVYKKKMNSTKKFKARDDLGVKENDTVLIEECVPFSKTVTWKVVQNLSEESSK